jgi:ketosteroid isomerase-like protein
VLADEVVLHVPGSHPLAGTYHGADALLDFVTAVGARADRTEHVELLDLLGGATHAAAYCRVTGNRPGFEPLDNTTVHVLRIEQGRIAEVWFHNWDQASVDAFWG